MSDTGTDLLRIQEGIERCANAAADSIVTRAPGLDRERIKGRVAYELWLAMDEVTECSLLQARCEAMT